MRKRFLARLLLPTVAVLLLLFGACENAPVSNEETGETTTDGAESTQTQTSSPPDSAEWLPLSENGVPLYSVLYQTTDLEEGTSASDYAKIARNIASKLNEKLGGDADFNAYSDRNIPEAATKTLTVGKIAGYSDSYFNGMRFQDYRIREENADISMAGYAYNSLYIASEHFLDAVELIDGDLYVKRTVLSESYSSYYQIATMTVGGNPIDDYTIVCNTASETMAKELRAKICTYGGYLLPIVKDTEARSEHEIVVGVTLRNTDDADYTGHRIYLEGESMVFACADPLEWAQVVTYTDGKFKNVTSGGSFALEGLARESAIPDNSRKLLSFNVKNVWNQNGNPGTRDDLTAALILEQSPDFVCLQEFDVLYRNAAKGLIDLISESYSEVTVEGTSLNNVWNPIFYNAEKYCVVDSGFVYFPDYVTCIEYDYPGGGTSDGMSKFRSLVWAVLEDKTDGTQYLIGNLHYSVERATHDAEAKLVVDKIKAVATQYPDCVTLVAGDYNSKHTHSDGGLKYMLKNGFSDTYDQAVRRNDSGTTHTGTEVPKSGYLAGAIDHVLTLDELSVYTYYVLTDEDLLPLSDHCPTIVQFSAPKQ